ncbi:MAG: radical SAM protein [Lachnospiraceae bacterium]|nr:radical SAM protein [Lachnospiraceae bacterium]
MKWTNKGNELTEHSYYKLNEFHIYIFGAGDIGRGLYITLSKFGLFSGFIDNSKNKQDSGFCNQKVYSYEGYLENQKDGLVIIAASKKNEDDICRQLDQSGVLYVRSGEFLSKYLPLYLYFERNILMMNLSQICVTERCTLRCENCAHGCYAVDINSPDMQLADIYRTADIFFSHIDYIHEFVLIGGEPLLYANLSEAVSYIGNKYRDKIGIFSITTNGTIIPKTDLLDECRKYDLFFRISNYSRSVPKLKTQYERLVQVLEDADIEYYLGKVEEEWWDYGFTDYIDRSGEDSLVKKFDKCSTPCREIRCGKLYFCVMARTVSDNLKYEIGKEDYLDLCSLPDGEIGRKILLEYNMGYSEKGFLSMCARCRGGECVKFPVVAAKQMEKKYADNDLGNR